MDYIWGQATLLIIKNASWIVKYLLSAITYVKISLQVFYKNRSAGKRREYNAGLKYQPD